MTKRAGEALFNNGHVKVTPTRLTVGSVDYPVAAITSVRAVRAGAPWFALPMCACGVASMMGSGQSPVFGVVGLALLVYGFVLFQRQRPLVMVISTSGRDVQAVTGTDDEVRPILAAMRNAIDERG